MKVVVKEFGAPGGLTLLKLPASTDKCQACAVKHDPSQPHNAQSMYYQYWFYEQYKRWPNWKDAMEHCPDDVKAIWRQALMDQGVDVEGGKVNPT